MPGRPLRDDKTAGGQPIGNQCRSIAYARVGGDLALLVANHCRSGSEYAGSAAFTNNWVQIGTWGLTNTAWANNDLAYIDLADAFRPYYGANQVYRGEVPGNNWWTITTQPGQFDGCDGFPAGNAFPDTSYQNWQATKTSTTAYRTGHVTDWYETKAQRIAAGSDGCLMQTDFSLHSQCCDSGSPFIRYSDTTTVNGIATTGFGGVLQFNPLHEGLQDLDAFWDAQNGTGAWLCTTSAC